MSRTSCTTALELVSSHTDSSSIYKPCVLSISLQISLVEPYRFLPPSHHGEKTVFTSICSSSRSKLAINPKKNLHCHQGRPRVLGCPSLSLFWLPTYYLILKKKNVKVQFIYLFMHNQGYVMLLV